VKSAELANTYLKFSASFHTERWTQPVNLPYHRRQLATIDLATDQYPESFLYDTDDSADYLAELDQIEQALPLCDDIGAIAKRVLFQLERDRELALAISSRDDNGFSIMERAHYGMPDDRLVARAEAELSQPSVPNDDDPSVDAEALRKQLDHALRNCGLNSWQAELDAGMAAKASVNGPKHLIHVRADAVFTPLEAERLVVHEFGGHVLRWVNSTRQSEPWAKVPLGNTVPTEEGLAVCRESEFGLLDEATIRKYQVRCLAVHVAATGGIMDVMRAISPYLDQVECAEIAIRTKRGLIDPNAPGGATKDWGYYDGFIRTSQLRTDDEDAYALLCAVKWTLEDLPLIQHLATEGLLAPPQIIPTRELLGLTNDFYGT